MYGGGERGGYLYRGAGVWGEVSGGGDGDLGGEEGDGGVEGRGGGGVVR